MDKQRIVAVLGLAWLGLAFLPLVVGGTLISAPPHSMHVERIMGSKQRRKRRKEREKPPPAKSTIDS